tara:strand:+ start:37109 stop:37453 length:345 start_codon:yes stop_codon:yes gene_type:complete
MEEKQKEEGAIAAWIRQHPKKTLMIMGVILLIGVFFHVYDGYVNEPKTFEEVAAEPLKDYGNIEEKVNISKFSNQVDDIMKLREMEEELTELLSQENLDTTKLKELEERILNTQ